MHIEATLAVIASAVSAGVIARMVMRQMRQYDKEAAQVNADIAAYVDEQLKNARVSNLTITVTNKETHASVQLPPHYDRAAVSRFLEITS